MFCHAPGCLAKECVFCLYYHVRLPVHKFAETTGPVVFHVLFPWYLARSVLGAIPWYLANRSGAIPMVFG